MEYELSKSRQILERTGATLESLLLGLSDDWLDATEGPDTWSPRQVVAHLIGAERWAWTPRLRTILEFGEGRTFPVFDRVAEIKALGERPIADLVLEFRDGRRNSLGMLDSLDLGGDTLSKTGTHPEFGRVELRQLLAAWTVHDLAHLSQIQRTMAKQYTDAVGPWRAYLRIIR